MKIKYVQLESDVFLTGINFVLFTPAERVVYFSLILYLTSNNGKCTFEPEVLSWICKFESVKEFEKIIQRVSKKFQLRKGFIRHKSVTKELKKVKHFQQVCAKAGLKEASKRWGGHNYLNGVVIAKERKRNEKVSKDITNTADHSIYSSDSLRNGSVTDQQVRALHFHDALSKIIPHRSCSDRTCFRNVTNWLLEGCVNRRFNALIFERVLSYAKQARQGENPTAVFMAILKEEPGYEKVKS